VAHLDIRYSMIIPGPVVTHTVLSRLQVAQGLLVLW